MGGSDMGGSTVMKLKVSWWIH